MNYLDYFMLVILGWGLVRGYFRGLISETSSILGVVAGFWAARHWYPAVGANMAGWVKNPDSAWVTHPQYPIITAFLLIFFVVYFVVSLLGWAIKTLAKVAQLGWMDRLFGAVFGLVKASMQCSIIIFALTFFNAKGETTTLENSHLAPTIVKVTVKVVQLAPADWRADFLDKLETIKVAWQANKQP